MEALHIETALLPTALLSTQSDGFDGLFFQDGSGWMEEIWKHWMSVGIRFDGIYSGFLGSAGQVGFVSSLMRESDGLRLVDPVLGDNGELYQTISRTHADAMISLVRRADVITPNFTEAKILAGLEDLPGKAGQGEVKDLVSVLRSYGPDKGVITSVPLIAGGYGNVAWDGKETRLFAFEDAGVSYPGAGDLFASTLFSLILRGEGFFASAQHATGIASETVHRTKAAGRERRMGINLTEALLAIRRRCL